MYKLTYFYGNIPFQGWIEFENWFLKDLDKLPSSIVLHHVCIEICENLKKENIWEEGKFPSRITVTSEDGNKRWEDNEEAIIYAAVKSIIKDVNT